MLMLINNLTISSISSLISSPYGDGSNQAGTRVQDMNEWNASRPLLRLLCFFIVSFIASMID